MTDRWDILRSMFSKSGTILEVGPLARGIAPRRDGYAVTIVDHMDADGLRAKYRDDASVDTSLIEDVDVVWDGRPIDELLNRPGAFDAVIASHVIEHVPNMIGFLVACERLLKPSGVLVLAVPDHRRCFDVARPLSSLGSILQAHAELRTTHTPGIAFDNIAFKATLDGESSWHMSARGRPEPAHSFAEAHAAFESARQEPHQYVDYHGWVFTPSSFRLAVHELHAIGAIGLRERTVEPGDGNEFYVALASDGPESDVSGWDLLIATLEDEHAAVLDVRSGQEPDVPSPAGMVSGSADQHHQVTQERLVDDLRSATERIREFEGSTSWKVTAPMRAVGQRIRGLRRRHR